MVVLRFALIAIVWFPAIKLTECFIRNQIPNACHGKSSEWGIIAINKAWVICNALLKTFQDSLPKDLSHWYLSAWADEYTTIVSLEISYIESYQEDVQYRNEAKGDLRIWKNLDDCEKVLIRFQQIINALAAHLQCASSTALIVPPSIYLNVMPGIDQNACYAFRSYVHEYNRSVLINDVGEFARKQPECVNRMLNDGAQSAWNAEEKTTLDRIGHTLGRLSRADDVETKTIMETVENETKGLMSEYLRARQGKGDHQWNDCHVIANDIEDCQKSEYPHKREFSRFKSRETCLRYLDKTKSWTRNTEQNFENILRMATLIYYNASKDLVFQFMIDLDGIQTMPAFTQAAQKLVTTVFEEFADQILLWRDAIQNYKSTNKRDFLTKCNELREHFTTVQETTRRTEADMRAFFRQNAVYNPIIPPRRLKFNPNDAPRLIAEYSAAFNAQFDNNSRLHVESRLKAKEAIAKSLFGKFFSTKSVYLQSYSEFLADCVLELNINAWKLDATQHWNSYFSKLERFVEALNKYGDDCFKLIHPVTDKSLLINSKFIFLPKLL